MKLIKTGFKDLFIIKHNLYVDNRGYFKEKFIKQKIEKIIGYQLDFCQDNSVKSNINVLRGLHYQKPPYDQSKLISISIGKILDIAVDIRDGSKTYGMYFSKVLDAKNHESLFIPKGFAHGYLTLSDSAIVNYKVDNYYSPSSERGISYLDEFLKIDWGVDEKKIIISKKDKDLKPFSW
tara:strand:- start:15983 stop:16519 length:537 start_codon:yes stop_codon:yes gene_type:complete